MSPDVFLSVMMVALFGGFVAADETACGQFMISRPLVAGFVTGLLTGNPLTGCALGALFELLYIDVLPAGGSRFPSAGLAAVAAVSVFSYLGIDRLPDAGGFIPVLFLVSALTATVSGLLVVRERKVNTRLLGIAVKAVREGDFGRMERAHLSGILFSLGRGVLTVLLVFAVVIPLRGLIERTVAMSGPRPEFLLVPYGALGVSMVMRGFLRRGRLFHFVVGGLAALALLRFS